MTWTQKRRQQKLRASSNIFPFLWWIVYDVVGGRKRGVGKNGIRESDTPD
jgi:hypothetical protein